MNFSEALEQAYINGNIGNAPVEMTIYFEDIEEGTGYATMYAPKFYKNAQNDISSLKRAWDYCCRGKKGMEDSITEIKFVPINEEKIQNKKIA